MTLSLWFDVGIKRYTTVDLEGKTSKSCGLMQESKDIQRDYHLPFSDASCGLMQESKDIQPEEKRFTQQAVVV